MRQKTTRSYQKPSTLDFLTLSERASNVIHKYKEYRLAYIIDAIYTVQSRNRALQDQEYTPLCGECLKNKVRNYREYIGFLMSEGIIASDGHYIPDEKCIGYKFTEHFETAADIEEVIVTKRQEPQLEIKPSKNDAVNNNVLPLSYWYQTGSLTIDYDQAIEYAYTYKKSRETGKISEEPKRTKGGIYKYSNATRQYNSSIKALTNLLEGATYFSIDDTSYRLHTNLSNLGSVYRHFISYDGAPLVGIDLKNSQPYLSSILFRSDFWEKNGKIHITSPTIQDNTQPTLLPLTSPQSTSIMIRKCVSDSDEIKRYRELVGSGQFYETFGDKLTLASGAEYSRQKVKETMFLIFFTDNRYIGQSGAESKRLFKVLFPTVYQAFSSVKRGNKDRLAILLQRIESAIFLSDIAVRIREEAPNLPLFSLHDSFLVPSGHEQTVASIMKDALTEYTGFEPSLSFEHYCPSQPWQLLGNK